MMLFYSLTNLPMKELSTNLVNILVGKTLVIVAFLTKKKYIVAYLSHDNEIVICDFAAAKFLK